MTPDTDPATAPAINERFGGRTRRGLLVSETADAVDEGAKIDPLVLMVKLAVLVTTLIVVLSGNVVIWSVIPEPLAVGVTTKRPREDAADWMAAMAEDLCSG
jgi:hypothetical protein